MRQPTVDYDAIQAVILQELARQGVEFASVHVHENFSGNETHIVIETMTIEQINPKYVENVRVSNQITTGVTKS